MEIRELDDSQILPGGGITTVINLTLDEKANVFRPNQVQREFLDTHNLLDFLDLINEKIMKLSILKKREKCMDICGIFSSIVLLLGAFLLLGLGIYSKHVRNEGNDMSNFYYAHPIGFFIPSVCLVLMGFYILFVCTINKASRRTKSEIFRKNKKSELLRMIRIFKENRTNDIDIILDEENFRELDITKIL